MERSQQFSDTEVDLSTGPSGQVSDTEKLSPSGGGGLPLICFPCSEFITLNNFPIISKSKQQQQQQEQAEEDDDEDEWVRGASRFQAKEDYMDDNWVIEQAKSHMQFTNDLIHQRYLTDRATRLINTPLSLSPSPSPSLSPSLSKRKRIPSPQSQPRPNIWYAKRLKHMPAHFTAAQATRDEGAIILDTQRPPASASASAKADKLVDSLEREMSRLRQSEGEADLERQRLARYHKVVLRQILILCTNAVVRYFGEDPRAEHIWSQIYCTHQDEIVRGLGLGDWDCWIKPANALYNDMNDAAHSFTDDTYLAAIRAVGGSEREQAKWMQLYDFVRRVRADAPNKSPSYHNKNYNYNETATATTPTPTPGRNPSAPSTPHTPSRSQTRCWNGNAAPSASPSPSPSPTPMNKTTFSAPPPTPYTPSFSPHFGNYNKWAQSAPRTMPSPSSRPTLIPKVSYPSPRTRYT